MYAPVLMFDRGPSIRMQLMENVSPWGLLNLVGCDVTSVRTIKSLRLKASLLKHCSCVNVLSGVVVTMSSLTPVILCKKLFLN